MEVIGIRTKKTMVGPGIDAIDAEMKIWDENSNGYKYLHYNASEGDHYTVATYSIFDYMTGESESDEEPDFSGFEEEYASIGDALASNYIDGFIVLDRTVKDMCDITYGHRESVYSYIDSKIDYDTNFDDGKLEDDSNYYVVKASFKYKSKSMSEAKDRTVICKSYYVENTEEDDDLTLVSDFKMYDENNNIIESFDDITAAENSKWFLIYNNCNNLIEESDAIAYDDLRMGK